jgi:hemolysin activation/secretion protein
MLSSTTSTCLALIADPGLAQIPPLDQRITQSNPPPSTTEPSTPPETLIPIKRITVSGSTVFSEEQLNQLTAPLLKKSVTLSQIRDLADQITQLYLDKNYITSRAILPTDQDINTGVIKIQVIEGTVERIEVKRAGGGGGRLSENYIRDRVANGVGVPLNFARVEDELQLMRADPLISDLKANLTAGSGSGLSVLEVTFAEAKSFSVNPFTDNYGNPATGIFRGGVNVQEMNLTGNGDKIFGGYTRSGSSDSFSFGYQYPINARGGTLDFNFSTGANPIVEPPFDTLNIKTDSQTYELTYRQPLIRTPREEFALSLGLAVETSNSFFDGQSFNFQTASDPSRPITDAIGDGRSQSTIIRFGQDLILRDPGGAFAFRSTFNFGISALGATVRANGDPDGRFFSWAGQALRVQRLGSDRDTLALIRLGIQLTGDSLLPLNRYSIGGPQSVRGYRQNQATGDSGIQGSIEFQLPVVRDGDGVSLIKLLPFFDVGTVFNSKGSNPNPQTLAGAGLGLLWQPGKSFTIRLDYGIPLNKVNNSTSNLQDSGFYFSVNANL